MFVRKIPVFAIRRFGDRVRRSVGRRLRRAERGTDPDQMRHQFHTISDGGYAELLYDLFGKERVEAELQEFLKHDFVPRYGGGIGITRLIAGMKKAGLM